MEPAIRSLKIENLLSFRSAEIELRNLNVLIGANGSGKTNLIELLNLLHCTPRGLVRAISDGGGIEEWLWKGSNQQPLTSIQAITQSFAPELSLSYCLEIKRDGFRVSVYEVIRSVDKQGREVPVDPGDIQDLEPYNSMLEMLRDHEHHPEITYLGRLFERFRIYSYWEFGGVSTIRVPCDASLPSEHLDEDGSNFGVVLATLLAKPPIKKQILEYLRLFNENATDLRTSVEGGRVQTRLEENHLSHAIPLIRLSDGTIRWLALLTILLDPDPPPLVCIEEPELGLHPDMIHELAKLLIDASSRMQLIITTHSDRLVEEFTEMPEAVVVCEKENGASSFRRLDPAKLEAWLKDYSLGELWTKGTIGGNRW